MGRQKIEIKKIEQIDRLRVAFSKRRAGLIKKASELCILCGVQVGIIVFSPAGKVYSFGHPNVESVIDGYVTGNDVASYIDPFSGSANGMNELEVLMRQLEFEKKREKMLENAKKAGWDQFWYNAPIENLELVQLEQMRVSVEELKMKVVKRSDELSWNFINTEVFDSFVTPATQYSSCIVPS
ncbi:hypothetical protein IFM89_001755 [Coptis chinensis]|uniref:MADS-box domain-containing protein n=1 Tax=Coptis chinensis TaxID=261450 RepID=A0A835HK46_9MAGN|nr:hypothetical protein IFM89_001755 [Coptis chinensis]